jgi:poly(A) polymerase
LQSKPKSSSFIHKTLNHKWIDPRALSIVQKLQSEGFETYLVGGCVRDLLLGLEPKDFDIATTARPRQVKKLIRNTFIIGRRFRLVLAKEGQDQFEISTFRRNPTPEEQNNPEISDDNLFGTSEEDAQRRDFTINALFYDPVAQKIIDHTNGVSDLKTRQIRMIGDPDLRLREDPIRILRAIRFSHKTNCEIMHDLKEAISRNATQLIHTALPRRREEILKILRLPNPASVFFQMLDIGVLNILAPSLCSQLENPKADSYFRLGLSKLNYQVRAECEPYELFSTLILPQVFAEYSPYEAHKWFQTETNINMLKNELGLFNTEIHVINQALKSLDQVLLFKDYENFRDRQKVDFLNQKSFAEAVNIGYLFDFLDQSQVHFWAEQYFNYSGQNTDKVNNLVESRFFEGKKKKKRKRKKKKNLEQT